MKEQVVVKRGGDDDWK